MTMKSACTLLKDVIPTKKQSHSTNRILVCVVVNAIHILLINLWCLYQEKRLSRSKKIYQRPPNWTSQTDVFKRRRCGSNNTRINFTPIKKRKRWRSIRAKTSVKKLEDSIHGLPFDHYKQLYLKFIDVKETLPESNSPKSKKGMRL